MTSATKIACRAVASLSMLVGLLLLPNTQPRATAQSALVGTVQPAHGDPTKGVSVNPQPASGYLIGSGDILNINVWRESEISQKLVVRPDGMITLPLVGDVAAAGQTPEQLADVVSKRLETVLTNPQVSVIVAEVHSKFYVVVGQVAKPGEYPLTRPTSVIEAVSQAGGFRDFAKPGKMYVLHTVNGKRIRVPVDYNQVVKGKKPQQDIEVSSGDAVVVP
jgi:polysaccharide export outer membrane protein